MANGSSDTTTPPPDSGGANVTDLYENGGPLSSAPSVADLMALAGGGGAIPTAGADVWGTGNFGSMPVLVENDQSGGPVKNPALGGVPFKGGLGNAPYNPLTFTEKTRTVNEMLQAGYKRSSDDIEKLQHQMWLAGMYDGTGITNPSQIPYGQYDESTIQAYANLLVQNAKEYSRGIRNTINDTLGQLTQQRVATGQTGNGTTRTSTSFDLSDPETAKAILSNVFQAYEGVGMPNPDTVAAFQSALGDYEKSHPSVSTSTYGATGGGTDTSSTGGLTSAGRTQFAQDWLFQHQGNQVANYQAATTYYQAALQALRAPVNVS